MSDKIKAAFATELTKNDPNINLARAALLMAGYLGQTSEVVSYLNRLDAMAQTAQLAVESADTDLEIIKSLNRYLFNELNFYGNSADYYHPNNSFLNKVLDTKTGIPISLSVVYMEVGWRLGLPLWGIGMPGHFIVGYGTSTNPIYIDVFDEGRILSEDDCLNICKIPSANRVDFRAQYLKPAARKDILFRMLLNLKQIYVRRENWESAYNVSDLMLLVRPDEITEIRDRGLMAYRLNRLHDAIFDINRYLFLAPDSIDANWLEQRLEKMDEALIRLN